jgi:tetratricopeptide (TPR) repeat protein
MPKKRDPYKAGHLGAVIGILVFLIIAGGVFFIVRHEKNMKFEREAVEIDKFNPRQGTPQTIDGLKKAIAYYDKDLSAHEEAAAKIGVYWKILGTRFRDRTMWFDALDAFNHAILHSPDDDSLHFLIGLSAASAAKSAYSQPDAVERVSSLYETAEKAYRRAIEIAPENTQARYALAVLYVFELNRPADAIPLFDDYFRYASADVDAMFLLARAYYQTGRYQDAVDMYNRIISTTQVPERAGEAERNRNIVLGQMGGRAN